MRKQLWIDFETGGVNPWVHSPLSCAMLAVDENGKIFGEWYGQIRQAPFNVTEEAMAINKLNLDHAGADFEQFRQIYFKLINSWFYGGTNWQNSGKGFLRPYTKPSRDNMPLFCGHNTHFDRSVLQQILGGDPYENKYDGIYYHRIDTMILANTLQYLRIIPRGENLKLETLCKLLEIEPVEGEMHNALTDIKSTHRCFMKMSDLLQEANHEYAKIRAGTHILRQVEIPSAGYGDFNQNAGQDLQSSL